MWTNSKLARPFIKGLIAPVLVVTLMTSGRAEDMSVACTKHGGIVVCFSVPGPPPVPESGPCYAAEKRVVEAENYAAKHSNEPDMIAKMMGNATDNLFKACSILSVPQAANVPRQQIAALVGGKSGTNDKQ